MLERGAVEELLRAAARRLEGRSPSPRLDAELLLAEISGWSRLDLVRNHRALPSEETARSFERAVERRREGEPVSYIVGRREFWGLPFEVTPDVLIPRPETELIVERGLRFIEEAKRAVRGLDLGVGSGCISVALAVEAEKRRLPLEITALDKSIRALALARRNAELHGVVSRLRFMESDWFSALPVGDRFDLVVANPPYVPRGAPGQSPELRFEPESALYSEGDEGTADIAAILSGLKERLACGGLFLCEIGWGQADQVGREASKSFSKVTFEKDYGGIERMLVVVADDE